jgi:lysozyme
MSFTTDNRGKPLWQTVAYHDVPMFRALALALDHAQEQGACFAILSADRRDAVLAKFNKEHGTHLHGQGFLFEHQHDPGFFPANRPGTTSHCLFADGNPAYRVNGRIVPVGGKLPNYFLGIDACDEGPGARANDCSRLIGHLERLGYHVTRPYHTGSEAHHFSFTSDPTPVLIHWGRIAAPVIVAKAKAPIVVAANGGRRPALSPKGAQFIAGFEGFRGNLYNDPVGHATIGFGHLVHLGPINGSEPAQFKKGLTRPQALALLRQDATPAATTVARCVKVPLTQAQFDALVSFTFNLGAGALQTSTLLRKVNAREFGAVPAEFEKWVLASGRKLPGLVRRRTAEARLFTSGKYA